MGGVCGVAVESDAVRISYYRDGQRVEDSIDAEGARWLLNGKLVDCGPFDDVVLTGRDSDAVEALLGSLDTGDTSTIRMVDESSALMAYARSVDELAGARALLVLDLGRYGTSAFTLDVAAGQVTRTSRRAAFSGEVLDDHVERLVMAKGILPAAHGVDAEREYRDFFRELKELITESAGVRAPGNGPMLLTREEFDESITSSLLQTLAWAAPEAPDAVLLIGGQARIPLVRTLVEQEWTVPLVLPESPSWVVVEGAALEALPTVPEFDLDAVLEEQYAEAVLDDDVAGRDVPETESLHDAEPATTPIGIVGPIPASSGSAVDYAPDPAVEAANVTGAVVTEGSEVTEGSKVTEGPEVTESPEVTEGPEVAETPARRRIRWSVRDAAGMAAVAAVALLVWAVVFVRGDTPPPPGIGVAPVDSPTISASIAEGVPPTLAPDSVPPVIVQVPESAEAPSLDETGSADFGEEQFAEVGFGSGTGLDARN